MGELDLAAIEACVRGDQQAWNALVKQFQPEVARQMWRFSRDRAVREELIQNVFVELFYSLPKYQARGIPFEHWVRRIATRVGYRHWKQSRQGKSFQLSEATGGASPGPLQSMEASDAAELLHRLLARLRPADRLVLTLTYFEQCDTREIADRTGWTRPMVKMRLMRARGKLRVIAEANGLGNETGSLSHEHRSMDRVARPTGAA